MSSLNLSSEYRKGVGIVLINHQKKVFVGQRIDKLSNAWQMPQGGIEDGEDPLHAALRELEEEIGTSEVEVLSQTQDWLKYDLPEYLVPTFWGGKYKGQEQLWFLMRLSGGDELINLNTQTPEFSAWKWIDLELLPNSIVEFKRDLYLKLVEQFKPIINSL
jgi:putative (di)nucleoside polyphosphate hydrolase